MKYVKLPWAFIEQIKSTKNSHVLKNATILNVLPIITIIGLANSFKTCLQHIFPMQTMTMIPHILSQHWCAWPCIHAICCFSNLLTGFLKKTHIAGIRQNFARMWNFHNLRLWNQILLKFISWQNMVNNNTWFQWDSKFCLFGTGE